MALWKVPTNLTNLTNDTNLTNHTSHFYHNTVKEVLVNFVLQQLWQYSWLYVKLQVYINAHINALILHDQKYGYTEYWHVCDPFASMLILWYHNSSISKNLILSK